MSTMIPVIGLEVHLQLKTVSKIFCGCATQFGAPPNSQVCPVCLGLPGVLPVLNRQVLLHGIRVALGLSCRIQPKIVFHRKNYFYPDLPKGYQISQYDLPLGSSGTVELAGGRAVRINRVHMEEDAGKLMHKADGSSLVDLNRAGVPLLEIVSEPDLNSPEEAYEYLKTLKGILEYLEVSDCDMEKGSLRCDANISLGTASNRLSGAKVEIKNLNSFRAVAHALSFEIQRQGRRVQDGEKISQETRLWDDVKGATQGMRSKEFAHDYRYFPEPDLVPFSVPESQIEQIRQGLPELPAERAKRFGKDYQLPEDHAITLTKSKFTADYYEKCTALHSENKQLPQTASFKKWIATWLFSDIAREMNERNVDRIDDLGFPPAWLIELIGLMDSGKISGKMAKEVLTESLNSKTSPAAVVKTKGMEQVTDRSAIRSAAQEVLQEHAQPADDYRKGKKQALMFLVGQLMRKTKGAASPALSQEVLRELLEKQA